MRWKAFFRSMFDWRNLYSPRTLLDFPLETIVFSVGVGALLMLIGWIAGG